MKMANSLLSVALTLICVTSAANAGTVLPVFIFAGQSNTVGMGKPSELPAALQQHQANVLFDNAFVNSTPAWVPLQPPTEPGSRITPNGGRYATDFVDGVFGPELMTGLGISNAMGGQQVAEVKYAVGATNLANDWNPAAPTTGRQFYPVMVSRVKAAVAALQLQNPTKTVQIAGFFWHQGESDQGLSEDYQSNLTNFISHVRADFNNPNLPFIIGQLGPHYIGDPIFQAQANVSTPGSPACIPNTYTVPTTDLPMIFDGFHYNTMGQRQMGNRYAMAYEKLTGLPVQEAPIISDSNLLSGKPVVVSSDVDGTTTTYDATYATDGTIKDQVFKGTADGGSDNDWRMAIHGFNSEINKIRIWRDWTDANRLPSRVVIKSSVNDKASLVANDYETLLTSTVVTLSPDAFAEGYVTINVNAPAGTKSLFLDFGNVDSNGNAYGVRVAEVQAFAVPEPASITMAPIAGGGADRLPVAAARCEFPDESVGAVYMHSGGHFTQDASSGALGAIQFRIRPDRQGIDLLPAPGR